MSSGMSAAKTLTCDVAIVGSGPTGMTLAHLLGQAGVKVILIERNATTVTQPRAVSIDDEALLASIPHPAGCCHQSNAQWLLFCRSRHSFHQMDCHTAHSRTLA